MTGEHFSTRDGADDTDDGQHYFTAEPLTAGEELVQRVRLAGRSVEVVTARGVFSTHGIDKGTAVLLKSVPPPPATGTFLDLGCGWGPLALTLAMHSPDAVVHAVDVNKRALDLVERNADLLGTPGVQALGPDQVPATASYDLIWSNPPIRVGKSVLHELLQTWLPRLAPGGQAWLVVQKNLGADSLLRWMGAGLPADLHTERVATAGGFRVLCTTRRS